MQSRMRKVMAADSLAARAFRENVRAIIEARDITITDLADALEMSRPGLSRILAGKEAVTLDRAEKISKYLKVDLPLLLRLQKKVEQVA